MSSVQASNGSSANKTPSSTPTYTAPSSYAPSDASSIKSTSSTVKKHLLSVFNRQPKSSSTPVPTTRGPIGKDGLTNEEKSIRNAARASYYSTL